jgi:hypothetical protein
VSAVLVRVRTIDFVVVGGGVVFVAIISLIELSYFPFDDELFIGGLGPAGTRMWVGVQVQQWKCASPNGLVTRKEVLGKTAYHAMRCLR